MTPVDQTATGPRGNCFAACAASVLDLPLTRVPDLRGEQWGAVLAAWRARDGRGTLRVAVYAPVLPSDFDGHAIALGDGPRGRGHAVVWSPRRGIVHDPHPDRTGLIGRPSGFVWFEVA